MCWMPLRWPLLVERDLASALARVQREDFALPDDAAANAELRTIVARALARDGDRRYADAPARSCSCLWPSRAPPSA